MADDQKKLHATLKQLADELDAAARIRAGAMDSQSRADDLSAQVRGKIQSVSQRLRVLAEPVDPITI